MKIALTLIWTAFWWFLSEYLLMPTWALSASGGIYANLFVYFGILSLIWLDDGDLAKASVPLLVVCIVFFLIGICIDIFGSWAIFHSYEYQGLIGKVQETEFTSNISPVAPNQMLIVDKEIARRIGEKELGSDPGLGSRAELGEFTLQPVAGKLYWIAPLEHSGYWKWNRFDQEGTPGYVRVSATNQEDYALVRTVNGKDIHIKYQTGSYFSQDLERHIYTNGYRSDLFKEFTFEVDDNWNPYWTVTLYDTRVGFDGEDAVGVLVVDPETGDIKPYTVQNAPAWVDRIQPEDFVSTQVDDWGNYIHGWWNWSNSDIKRIADENSLVLGNDGRSYFYFGLTSSGNDNSTVGFVMVDTKTKQAHWFKQAGATEKAARGSAEGKVQEKGYVGSDGITYNIGGHPTYEFLLKDKAGLMKLIALVNVHNHAIVGVGENRHDAIRDYRTQIANTGNAAISSTSEMDKLTLVSKVRRFASEVVKGNTSYHFILEQKPAILFTAGTNLSDELTLTKEGDPVKVQYTLSNTGEVTLMDFDNQLIGIQKDTLALAVESYTDSIKTQRIEQKSNQVVEEKWEKLTPEEKKKMLQGKK